MCYKITFYPPQLMDRWLHVVSRILYYQDKFILYSVAEKCLGPVAVKQAQIITPPSLDDWSEVFVVIHDMFLPNMVLCIITTHFHNGLAVWQTLLQTFCYLFIHLCELKLCCHACSSFAVEEVVTLSDDQVIKCISLSAVEF